MQVSCANIKKICTYLNYFTKNQYIIRCMTTFKWLEILKYFFKNILKVGTTECKLIFKINVCLSCYISMAFDY